VLTNLLKNAVEAMPEKGDILFNFGKHKGKLVKDILLNEPGYYNWMMEGDFPQQTKNVLTRLRLSLKSN
jgi:DNA polymerase-3 subunit epsilon